MFIDCVAIDYDDTYTSDPRLWNNIIHIMQMNDYKIICATARTWSKREEYDLKKELGIDIVFCGNEFKRPACIKAGYNVKIWIDDTPENIGGPGILWLIHLDSFLRSTRDRIKRGIKKWLQRNANLVSKVP